MNFITYIKYKLSKSNNILKELKNLKTHVAISFGLFLYSALSFVVLEQSTFMFLSTLFLLGIFLVLLTIFDYRKGYWKGWEREQYKKRAGGEKDGRQN